MQLVSFDPATGEPVGQVPVATAADVDAAVARARAAQPAWAALGAEGRARLIAPAGAAFAAAAESLGALLCREMGKPLAEAIGEVRSVAGLDDELAEMVEALRPRDLASGRTRSELIWAPHGVCAAITPWNFPISMPAWMCLPALMAGNTVVLKPSEETPLIAQAYVDVMARGLPSGVLQIVHGDGAVGRALVEHPGVDLIAFTGSRATGVRILQAASARLARVVLELGGKDPLVVLADADVDAAAAFAVRNSFRNAGQVCVSTERIYVHEAIADRFEAAVVRGAQALRVGPGTDPQTQVGPMISDRQKGKVEAQVDAAVRAGATLATGGPADGRFFRPAVLLGVDHTMEVMTEETFGPVACIQRFRDVDEAIRLANETPYGLGASVFGVHDADRVARSLHAGMVGINRGCGGASGAPWVGVKQSGYGFHGGPDGHRQFAQIRVVSRTAE